MKALRKHGKLKAIGGVICAADGEHLGQMITRTSTRDDQCWDGQVRAGELCHWFNVGPKLVKAARNMMLTYCAETDATPAMRRVDRDMCALLEEIDP